MLKKTSIVTIFLCLTLIIGSSFLNHEIPIGNDSEEVMLVSSSNPLEPGFYSSGVKFLEDISIPKGQYSFAGPVLVPQGVTLEMEHGLIEIEATDVVIDGSVVCDNQFTGGGFGGTSNNNGQPGLGLGGGSGGNSDGGGGGGASYGAFGVNGQNGVNTGGIRGTTYGYAGLAPGSVIPTSVDIRTGSVGGGGAGGDGVAGGNGGAGGGAYYVQSSGSITVSGSITCDGAIGMNGDEDTGNGAGGGGGGSGGGVLLFGKDVYLSGTISTQGGLGGIKGAGGILGSDGGNGGNGGLGRIKIFYQETMLNTATLDGITHFEQLIIPTISIATPQFGNVYQPSQPVPLNLENTNGSYLYAWNDDPFTTVPTSYIPTTPAIDGVHTLSVNAYSNTSTLKTSTYAITVDGSIPTWEVVTTPQVIIAGTVGNDVEFNAYDAHPGLYNVTMNNTIWEQNLNWENGSNSYALDGLPLGYHNISLHISDYVWNSALLSFWVNVTQDLIVVTTTVTESNGGNITTVEPTQTVVSTQFETVTETLTEEAANSTNPSLPVSNLEIITGLSLVVVLSMIGRRRQ